MATRGKGGTRARPPAPPTANAAAREPAPPARPIISREFIAGHKRRRIMGALAELTTERSYEETKISDIVRRAGVARKTLYDNFEGKEEVFLAAFDHGAGEMLGRVRSACADVADLRDKVEAGLGAFLGYVAEEPAMAHLCMVESLSATPEATKRYEQVLEQFVELARDSLPHDERLPATVEETLVGGVAWIVYQQIRRGRAANVGELQSELTDFMLAPYLDGVVVEAADEAR